MGARLVVKFGAGTHDPQPMAYLHHGGEFVDDVKRTLDEFMHAVKSLPDSRLNDANYLAAKFVVWAAVQNVRSSNPLDFLSVGIVTNDGWGDAVATVHCNGTTEYTINSALDLESGLPA